MRTCNLHRMGVLAALPLALALLAVGCAGSADGARDTTKSVLRGNPPTTEWVASYERILALLNKNPPATEALAEYEHTLALIESIYGGVYFSHLECAGSVDRIFYPVEGIGFTIDIDTGLIINVIRTAPIMSPASRDSK